ncbi:MAG TPA: hypothetical protein VN767_00740, partial [Streptosporangiaceae bacterium]|nr:hypothetical protein [Streptosporangiaceae bacterium]
PVRRTGGLATMARRGSRRVVRFAGADGNPLRRGIDRMERALWILLLIGFLSAAPMLAPMAGRAAQSSSSGQVRNERSWREVRAVLLQRSPDHFYGYSSSEADWVRGRWRAPTGRVMTGMIPAEPGTPAGTSVPIWVDHDGRLTHGQPLTAGLVSARVVAVEVLAVAGLAIFALLLAAGIRWFTNRRRMTYWTIEWDCFGPRWSARHLAGEVLDRRWPPMVGFRA